MISTDVKETEEKKSYISKTIFAGNQVVKINSVKLMKGFNPTDMNLILEVETKPIEEDGFEGFLIDKDDESKGRHKGQVGSVKWSKWPFKNAEYKDGQWVDKGENTDYRDAQIVKAINKLVLETGHKLSEIGDNFNTIDDLVSALNKSKIFEKTWFNMAIGAREYYSKDNYRKQDLFLLKAKYPQRNFAFEGNALVDIIQYDPNNIEHLIPAKDVVTSDPKTIEAPKAPTIEQPEEDKLPF